MACRGCAARGNAEQNTNFVLASERVLVYCFVEFFTWRWMMAKRNGIDLAEVRKAA